MGGNYGNFLNCWIRKEFLNAASTGLPWWIHPTNQTEWDWLQTWNNSNTLYKGTYRGTHHTHTSVFALVWEQVSQPKLWLSYTD